MGDYGDDGFYNSGSYNSDQYGYGGGNQQVYGGGGGGEYTYSQQGFMQSQGYGQQSPTIMTPQYNYNDTNSSGGGKGGSYSSFEDEPPLLEELGINFEHISATTKSVLNPLQQSESYVLVDSDLAGPLVFCLAFGGFLLLSGKVHGFGYIYGVGVMGCLCMYSVLNLMSTTGVTLQCVVSVLGYCLLPMVLLSGLSVVFALTGTVGSILAGLAIVWCSLSASKLFVTALQMDHQQPLVMYPCALLYGVFALLTVF